MMFKNQKGQISIFFATTVLVLITFIAFIVNIGVFVKAKMNLQNAVDASAYAGASVQARQLTNIAYLNWEMRNIYKEWMFKYYVLGNITIDAVVNGAGSTTDLRMEPYTSGTDTVSDYYNIPSVCVDFQASGNVTSCKKAMVPGLPRFARTDVLGLEETMDTFVDSLSAEKAKDCAIRTSLNFMTNFIWAFNVLDNSGQSIGTIIEDAPDVTTNRPGAYPAALELALRIRNLEQQVNKPPYKGGVCIGGGGVDCSDGQIDSLVNADATPSNERIYKAFMSGFRNLGSSDCTSSADEFKCNFTLRELEPTPFPINELYSPSRMLMPSNLNVQKHYLDLKLQYLNFTTFFTMLAPNTTGRMNPDGTREVGAFQVAGVTAENTAECVSTKVAMPVPGYPIGFVKNPAVMTYYAVKGQTQFIGRFSPFDSPIKLTAFAAAKPFGGRIGPMLFDMSQGDYLTARKQDQGAARKSSAYLSRIRSDTVVDRFGNNLDIASVLYAPGVPIPARDPSLGDYFAKDDSERIGGKVDSDIFFVIPNIPYDFPGTDPNDMASYTADTAIQEINGANPLTVKAGLYNGAIFNKLRERLPNVDTPNISRDEILSGVFRSRAPTLYDIHHYLVPTPETLNKEKGVDSYGIITKPAAGSVTSLPDIGNAWELNIYAPLFSSAPDSLYTNEADVVNAIDTFLELQTPAIRKYRSAMNIAAYNISASNTSSRTGGDIGAEAAQLISNFDIGLLTSAPNGAAVANEQPGCLSLTGKFIWFYLGNKNGLVNSTGCKPEDMLTSMLSSRWTGLDDIKKQYYTEVYVEPDNANTRDALFSAYRPTEMNDGSADGTWTNTLNGKTTNKARNFYSTKFITLKSISQRDESFYATENFTIFSEGNSTKGITTIDPGNAGIYQNPLMTDPGNDFSRISH